VKNCLRVECQRNRVIDQSPVNVAGLWHVRKNHGNWAEDYQNDEVAQRNVFQSDSLRKQRNWFRLTQMFKIRPTYSGIKKRRRKTPKVHKS
jgi:hypothetical protein